MQTEQINPTMGENKIKNFFKNPMLRATTQVTIGTIIYCFGVVWILQLGGFFSGGVTGASQLIVGLIEKFGGSRSIRGYIGAFVGIINIPLLIFGWRGVSKHFAILTLISIVIQTLLMSVISNLTVSPFIYLIKDGTGIGEGIVDVFRDKTFDISMKATALEEEFRMSMSSGVRLVLAITGGLVTGVGSALCLKSGGSTGGIDIISNYLVMKKRTPFTKFQFTIDIIIICASSLISVENVMYTVIRLLFYVKVLQALYQTYQTTRIEIITDKAEEIKETLLKRFSHSMTIYDAVGGYTNSKKKVIEIYAMNFETPEYIGIINKIDSKAFVIITKVKMIRGNYNQRTIV